MTDFDAEWEAIKNDKNRASQVCWHISFDVCGSLEEAIEAYLSLGPSAKFAVMSRVMDELDTNDVIDAILGSSWRARSLPTDEYLVEQAFIECANRLVNGGPMDEVGRMAGDEILGAAILKMTTEGHTPADEAVQIYGRVKEKCEDVRKEE